MSNDKLDLHTLTVVLMALNGWHLMPAKMNDIFLHRVITNSRFCSQKAYNRSQNELLKAINLVFDMPALKQVHNDIKIEDVF